MSDLQQWIDENRPDGDPDYQRLAEVTGSVETEMTEKGDPKAPLSRRFDYDTALKFGMRRTEEVTKKSRLEDPDEAALITLLMAGWIEGFAFGVLTYRDECRGREAEPLLDQIALTNIHHMMATADEGIRNEIFAAVASSAALSFVGLVRSKKASQILREQLPVASHENVGMLTSSHWMDGLLAGLVFQEMGGHREK